MTTKNQNRDREGRSPLHYAAAENNVSEIEQLIDSGENPNVKDRRGYTPLHFAAQEGTVDAARKLLDLGADVNAVDKFGNAPLWTAVFSSTGTGDLIQLLRERNADPHHKNHAGRTPVELARMIGNYNVAQFFADLPI